MKKTFLLTALLSLFGTFINAQNGLEQITVEKYYISNTDDSLQADEEINTYNADNGASLPIGALPVGSVTYRVYADLLPDYRILSIFGDMVKNQDLVFKSTSSFYNHPYGIVSPVPGTSKTAIKNNLMALDTYYSFGGVATGNYGILKTEDDGLLNNVTTTTNPGNVLLNNNAAMGIPLTTQDGMIAGTGIATPATAGFKPAHEAFFNDGTVLSNSFVLIDGSWFTAAGAMGPYPTTTNKVLIGQFTTKGDFSFQINMLIKNRITDVIQYYAAKNPTVDDIQIPSLTYPLIANPPIVTLITPTTSQNYITGDVADLSATATDIDGTVSSVEFFVDGLLVGTDVSGPSYTATYTCAVGTHTVTAKATDNSSMSTTSSATKIHVKDNNAPSVSITAPVNNSNHFVNTVLTIQANASDPNGALTPIDSLQFFVDGVNIGTDTISPYSATYTCTVGTHTLTAVAKDSRGLATTSLAVVINVISGIPPTVSISSPVDNSVVYVEDVLSIVASASDADGSVASVEFFLGSASLGTDVTFPYGINYTIAPPLGLHCLKAIATDNAGLTTTSALVCIEIRDSITIGMWDVNKDAQNFVVYPNPAQNILNISFNNIKTNNNSYILYGMVGNVVVQKQLSAIHTNSIETIDISSIASGQYILTVTIDGVRSNRMIIKN